jgi:DNA-binding transcriptional MerR regulator
MEEDQVTPEVSVDTPVETPQAETTNPAWNSVLEILPSEFHSRVTPEFKKWDDNFRAEQEKYSPYKPLLENQIPPDVINQALQFYHTVNTRPQDVYNLLGQQLGITPAQAKEVLESQDAPSADDVDEDDPYQKKFKEMQAEIAEAKRQQQVLNETIQGEAYRLREAEEFEKIDSQIKSMKETHGDLFNTPVVLQLANAQMQAGMPFNLEAAFQQYQGIVQQAQNIPTRNELAPPILPASGGMPVNSYKSPVDMNEDERLQYFAARMNQAKSHS